MKIDEKFNKPYDPNITENKIYKIWEDSGLFNPDNLTLAKSQKLKTKNFCIVMPPPNANGDLHVGHSLFITLQDLMIRYKRMRGFSTLWIPGADHAGFETQVVYEKKLEKEGRSRFGMEKENLYKEIYDFTILNKQKMELQVRKMGASCDWSRERFTLDPDIVKKVQESFIKMNDDGLIYRGKRTINWCPKHQTSLSDVETESVEEASKFYYLKYGPFVIGTARPETKFGDKYVVMHPEDLRYKNYKHGETLEVDWINGKIIATIIKDESIDMEFGTGVMTITPWHSQIDFEIAERHNLEAEQIIDWRGKLLPIAKDFEGMKIIEAREKIIEKLSSKGLVEKIDEDYKHVVKRCYKCNTLIEPQIKDQWFVKMKPLAELALRSVDEKKIKFVPDNYEKIFRYWMENTLDWNISRQIVWGIEIPAWFKDGEIKTQMASPGDGWAKDTDTFDTWFSSGQWPLLVTNYPDGDDFKNFYPTSVMETGHDLIFKWVPRMIMFGLYFAKKEPFHTVYLHGLVNDAKGKKMSKSKGNVVNPLQMTDKYGTDALRMALVVGNPAGSDTALSENKIKGYKNFANKIWNIARFVFQNTEDIFYNEEAIKNQNDSDLIEEQNNLIKDITGDFENYRYHLASEKIYHYIWHKFADEIIEKSKSIISKESDDKLSRQQTLLKILKNSLIILHPFMPFVTEEIWSHFPTQNKNLLMIENWPN